MPVAHVGIATTLAVGSFVVAIGCQGAIGSHGDTGMGGAGAKPTDPGIIDQGGNTGAGNTTGTGTGGTTGMVTPCTAGNPPATTRLFRLTHAQYDNTVRALTGLDVRPSADFPVDQNQAGFDRGIDLQAGDVLGKAYRTAAETLAASVVGNATAFSKVVGCDPAGGNSCRDSFIADFGRRAFRRPLTDAEKTPLVALFGQGATLLDGTADAFHKGVQIVLEAMLQSPNFIYRPEMSAQASGGLIALGGYEMASRLSYFILNGPPDDALLNAAAGGQLATADGVAQQAQRLIATDAAKETVRDFHHQWLVMDAYANKLTKDSEVPDGDARSRAGAGAGDGALHRRGDVHAGQGLEVAADGAVHVRQLDDRAAVRRVGIVRQQPDRASTSTRPSAPACSRSSVSWRPTRTATRARRSTAARTSSAACCARPSPTRPPTSPSCRR